MSGKGLFSKLLNAGQQEAAVIASDKALALGLNLDTDAQRKQSGGEYFRSSSFKRLGTSYQHTEYVEAHEISVGKWTVQKIIQLQGINLSDMPGNLAGKEDVPTETRTIVPMKKDVCYVEALYTTSIYELTQVVDCGTVYEKIPENLKDSHYLERAHKDKIIFDTRGYPHIIKNFVLTASTDFPESEAKLPALWKEQDAEILAAQEAEKKRVAEEKRIAEAAALRKQQEEQRAQERMPVTIDWSKGPISECFKAKAVPSFDSNLYLAAVDMKGRLNLCSSYLYQVSNNFFTDKGNWESRGPAYSLLKFCFVSIRNVMAEYIEKYKQYPELLFLAREVNLAMQALFVTILAQTMRCERAGINYDPAKKCTQLSIKNIEDGQNQMECQNWLAEEYKILESLLLALYPDDEEKRAKVLMSSLRNREYKVVKPMVDKLRESLLTTGKTLETYIENGVRNFEAGEVSAPLQLVQMDGKKLAPDVKGP